MNKRMMKLLAGMFVLVMVVVGCTNVADETVPETNTETMDKDSEMKDDEMDKEDDMKEDAMDKEDTMDEDSDMDKEDTMDDDKDMDTHDDMKDDDMDKEDEAMKDDMEMMTNDGNMAPDFSFMDLNGETHNLADYKGQKVYIKYWASWCPICLSSLGEVDELFAQTDDYVVLTVVTPDANGELSKEDFMEWYSGLEYDNINVLFDIDGQVAKELGIRAFPTSVFIGSDGVLIQTTPGHKANADIDAIVESFH